jgi:hypothetical protein
MISIITPIKYKENIPMKNIVKILAVSVLFLSACKSTYQTRSMYDDVYYSKKDATVATTATQPDAKTISSENYSTSNDKSENNAVTNNENTQNSNATEAQVAEDTTSTSSYSNEKPNYSTSETYYDENGNPTEVNNNYFYDDYYDYAYSARLRRFYNPYDGFGYYDNYYTNYYWYTNNPWDWGVSIYCGSPWWYPSFYSFDPYWGGYNNYWGFGHSHWGWYGNNGWGNHGYWDGYGNYASNYYNSYDHNSHYYGPRTDFKTSNLSSSRNLSFGEKYQNATINTSVIKNNTIPAKPSNVINTGNITPVKNQASIKNVPANNKPSEPIPVKPAKNNITPVKPNNTKVNQQLVVPKKNVVNVKNGQQYSVPKGKTTTTTPTNNAPKQNYSKPKTYVSPSYSQPKSNQYYSKPKTYSSPGNNSVMPPKSNNNYSQPRSSGSPSYSAPKSSSSNTYSSPRSSSSSSSPAPSRSNSNSNSSSGSNGGHRR